MRMRLPVVSSIIRSQAIVYHEPPMNASVSAREFHGGPSPQGLAESSSRQTHSLRRKHGENGDTKPRSEWEDGSRRLHSLSICQTLPLLFPVHLGVLELRPFPPFTHQPVQSNNPNNRTIPISRGQSPSNPMSISSAPSKLSSLRPMRNSNIGLRENCITTIGPRRPTPRTCTLAGLHSVDAHSLIMITLHSCRK